MHYIFLAVSLLIICAYAPVENENKPLSAEQILLFRKISRIIAILLTLISCLIDIFHNPYVKLIDSTLLAISISILVVGLEERRECSEKRKEEHSEGCCESRCEKC
jgi:accessory gene regulator protein AgrB